MTQPDEIEHRLGLSLTLHAIYASATVHEGWWVKTSDTPPVIEMAGAEEVGGHAFALIGYNVDGFIIQNSWGPDWGFRGFAVLTYADWIKNGMDAWVAVMGAPVVTRGTAVALNRSPLQQRTTAPALRPTASSSGPARWPGCRR